MLSIHPKCLHSCHLPCGFGAVGGIGIRVGQSWGLEVELGRGRYGTKKVEAMAGSWS